MRLRKYRKIGVDIVFSLCYYDIAAYYGYISWLCPTRQPLLAVIARLEEGMVLKMYAIIETGGKQYKVENGDVIFVEKLAAEAEETVDFNVVALSTDDGIKVGAPYVEGAKVTGKVLKNGKGKKIVVSTYKPKKGEKRKMGHRQPYTKVEIQEVNA